jgi:hypothetical protein
MNERQRHALTHPLTDPSDLHALARLRGQRRHSDGYTIGTILAVDR